MSGRSVTAATICSAVLVILTLVDARAQSSNGASRAAFFDNRVSEYGIVSPFTGDKTGGDVFVDCVVGGEGSIDACTRIINDHRDQTRGGASTRAMALTSRGTQYGANGRYDLAISDLDQAIEIWPDLGPLYNKRGQTYGMKGDYVRAIQDFDQALRLMPNFAAALYNRGQTCAAEGDYDRAIMDFSRAIALNPKYVLAYDKRGDAYYAKKDYSRALADDTEAIRLSPDFATAYHGRANAYAMNGDDARALNDYSMAIHLEPNSAAFYVSRALILTDYNSTFADLNEAIRIEPWRADFYFIRGNVWYLARDDGQAQQDFDRAIKLNSANAKGIAALAWSLKGAINYQAGNFDAALYSYNEAVRLDPTSAPFHLSRGITQEARGERDLAIQDYGRAITLRPDEESAYAIRGLSYFSQGDFASAAADFRRLAQDSSDLHYALWHYLAGQRAGLETGKDELASVTANLKSASWPAPIFQLFQGQRAADSVQAAASNSRERCEAHFYTGQWHILQGSREAATRALHAAVQDCERTATEVRLALQDLKRLEKSVPDEKQTTPP